MYICVRKSLWKLPYMVPRPIKASGQLPELHSSSVRLLSVIEQIRERLRERDSEINRERQGGVSRRLLTLPTSPAWPAPQVK